MRSSSTGLATVVIFAILGQGYALNCWSCSSTRNRQDCQDPFNKTHQFMKDCNEDRSSSSHSSYSTAVCKKIKYRESEGGELITMRNCGWVNDHSHDSRDKMTIDCSSTSIPSHWKIEYCDVCKEDGCNGSDRAVLASTWCALVPIIMYLYSKATH